MKLSSLVHVAGCLVITCCIAASSYAQTGVTAGQPIILFGGNSLDGWTKQNGDPAEGWVVEEGALYRPQPSGDLYHELTFRDFELHFQWKIAEGGNSGLKYRVKQFGNQWLGCEYQILDDKNNPFNKHAAGSLYDVYEPNQQKEPKSHGVWNWSKIVVCGNRIEHWLNGRMVVAANVGDEEWTERIANSKFRGREDFGENRDGRIFLQDHGHPVWFKHIVLVPLNCGTSSGVASSSEGQPTTAFANGCCQPNPCCCARRPILGRAPIFRRRMGR